MKLESLESELFSIIINDRVDYSSPGIPDKNNYYPRIPVTFRESKGVQPRANVNIGMDGGCSTAWRTITDVYVRRANEWVWDHREISDCDTIPLGAGV